MQIKIEIDVKPDELRRFLGLPDVSGLQDDIVNFLREKVGAASEFDASQFVKSNLEALKRTSAWKNLVSRVRIDEAQEAQPAEAPKRRRRAAKAAGGEAS